MDTWWEAGDPERMAERVREALARTCGGGGTTVVAAAPGRVNLIGEHTDYNGGLCLPLALPHATYVAARARDDDRVRAVSAQSDAPWEGTVAGAGPGGASGWAAYAAGVLWALSEAGWDVPGVDLYVDSTVPLGAGLSSSAAIECAVGTAVAGLLGRDAARSADAVVAAGIRAESEVAGAPTGGMDQTVAVHGRAGHAVLIDFASGERRAVPLDLAADDLALLVVDTRVSHALTDGGYAARRADCEEAARRLGVDTLREAGARDVEALADERLRRRARHVVTEIERVEQTLATLADAGPRAIGPLMDASHASLRDDFEVSCPELDVVVGAARAGGALGARMTGGGFGGSAVALVDESALRDVRDAVLVRSAEAGFPEPRFLRAEPSPGARLLARD